MPPVSAVPESANVFVNPRVGEKPELKFNIKVDEDIPLNKTKNAAMDDAKEQKAVKDYASAMLAAVCATYKTGAASLCCSNLVFILTFLLYEVFSAPRCGFPCKYRKMLRMIFKLMIVCE